MRFELTKEEWKKAGEIINRVDEELQEKNSEIFSVYGACGGGWSYIFTPTSIGMFVAIKNCVTNETFDITDLDRF